MRLMLIALHVLYVLVGSTACARAWMKSVTRFVSHRENHEARGARSTSSAWPRSRSWDSCTTRVYKRFSAAPTNGPPFTPMSREKEPNLLPSMRSFFAPTGMPGHSFKHSLRGIVEHPVGG